MRKYEEYWGQGGLVKRQGSRGYDGVVMCGEGRRHM